MKKIFSFFLAVMFLRLFSFADQIQQNEDGLPLSPPEVPSSPSEDIGLTVLGRIDNMLQENNLSGAEELALASLDRLNSLRAALFSKLISAQLAQGKIAEARTIFDNFAAKDMDIASVTLDLFQNYYTQRHDTNGIIEWTQHIIQMPLSEDLKSNVFSWQIQTACSSGVSNLSASAVKNAATQLGPERCRKAFLSVIDGLIASGKYNDAAKLLMLIENAGRNKPHLISLVRSAQARIAIAEKHWNDAEKIITKNTKKMSDNDLADVIVFCSSSALCGEALKTIENICATIIADEKDKTISGEKAAVCSLKISALTGRFAEMPSKLDFFLLEGMAPDTLFALFNNHFYQVVLSNDSKNADKMLAFGKKLHARLRPEDRKQLAVLLIDGHFIIGDYAGALDTIEANKQSWDAEWNESAQIKIGAHLALQNKQYKKAAEDFRKYMDYVMKNNEVLRDPLSGQLYTSDMILGYNAMRIGDILKEHLGDNEGARKAYDEAEQYFRKAASMVEQNSLEAKYIDEQMSALASRKK